LQNATNKLNESIRNSKIIGNDIKLQEVNSVSSPPLQRPQEMATDQKPEIETNYVASGPLTEPKNSSMSPTTLRQSSGFNLSQVLPKTLR
jgi:hypothetical protein